MTEENDEVITKEMEEDFLIFEKFFSEFTQELQNRLNTVLVDVSEKLEFYRFFTVRLFLDLMVNDYKNMKRLGINVGDFGTFLSTAFNSINQMKDSFNIEEQNVH